jgi:hypothetical protein
MRIREDRIDALVKSHPNRHPGESRERKDRDGKEGQLPIIFLLM